MNPTTFTGQVSLTQLFKRTYAYMALTLLVTAGVSLASARLFGEQLAQLLQNSFLYLLLFVVQIGLVFIINKASTQNNESSIFWLFTFGAFEGIIFAPLFVYIEPRLIISAFVSASALFITMAVVGFATKIDTSKWFSVLFGATIAIIIVSLINLFLQASMLQMIVSWISIIIFSGWTIYDTQNLKDLYNQSNQENLNGLAVYGALNFYLDFINLFISILSILSGRHN